MIAQLRGKLADKRPNQLLADVTLLIYTHVREDALALYGFLTAREKHLFELLLSASGVGPVLALKILSGMSVDELVPAIRAGDLAQLTRIPGVGRKTAERMIVELRDKLAAIALPEAARAASRTGLEADVISALANLGYERRSAEKAVEDVQRAGTGAGAAGSFEALLRATLQQLSRPGSRAARAE